MRNYKKRKRNILLQRVLFLCTFISCVIIVFEIIYFSMQLQKPKFLSPIPFSNTYKKVLAAITSNSPKNELSELLRKDSITVVSITNYNDNSLLVRLEKGEEIIFSSKKSIKLQVSSLQLILSRLTIEGKRIAKLDLRFDNPVIVFATTQ